MTVLETKIKEIIQQDLKERAEDICEVLDSYKDKKIMIDATGCAKVTGTHAPEVQVEINKLIEIEKIVIRRFLTI